MMYGLLEKLCSIGGVSGREDKVREFIISEIDGFADWRVDPLGPPPAPPPRPRPAPPPPAAAAGARAPLEEPDHTPHAQFVCRRR